MLLVNGLPLVVIEAKTPVRQAVSWLDGALQIHDDYEKNVPELFVANVFSVATEGKELRFGAARMPVDLWGPWRRERRPSPARSRAVKAAVEGLLRPSVVLDILGHFTLFATDKKKRRIKVVCRYQQYQAVNLVVQRVLAGKPKKGLIWHFQGSGKSLLMVFAAQKLRMQPALQNPTVIIVVDRLDLDTQITAHVQRGGHAEPGEGRDSRRAAAVAQAGHAQDHHHDDPQVRRGGRHAERRGPTSSRWWTRRTAPRRATSAGRCARPCRTPSCSA